MSCSRPQEALDATATLLQSDAPALFEAAFEQIGA
jgi:hypothetical protein